MHSNSVDSNCNKHSRTGGYIMSLLIEKAELEIISSQVPEIAKLELTEEQYREKIAKNCGCGGRCLSSTT